MTIASSEKVVDISNKDFSKFTTLRACKTNFSGTISKSLSYWVCLEHDGPIAKNYFNNKRMVPVLVVVLVFHPSHIIRSLWLYQREIRTLSVSTKPEMEQWYNLHRVYLSFYNNKLLSWEIFRKMNILKTVFTSVFCACFSPFLLF